MKFTYNFANKIFTFNDYLYLANIVKLFDH
jgi:hypothetical protein